MDLTQRTSTNDDGNTAEEVIRLPNTTTSTTEPGPLTKSKLINVLLVFFSVFLDFMGMSLIQPILPFYANEFGANATQLGALYSAYAGMSLLASLFMGVASDRFGRKPAVIFSLFGTMIGYLATGLVTSYAALLGCRFLTGFFGGSAPVAFAVIADMVPTKDRSKYIASVGAMISLAFIIGPGLGSGLSVFGIRIPFYAASGLGACGCIFAICFMKETNPVILKKKFQKQSKKNDGQFKQEEQQLQHIPNDTDNKEIDLDEKTSEMDSIKVVNSPNHNNDKAVVVDEKFPIQVWLICIVAMLSGVAVSVYISMSALYMMDTFNFSTVAVGYTTLSSATIAIISAALFPTGSKYLGMVGFSILACLWFSVALLTAPNVDNVWAFLGILVFGLGVGLGINATAFNSIAVSLSNFKTRGRITGLTNAASTLASIIGPLVHGALYQIDTSYPFYLGSGSLFVGAMILALMICKWPELRRSKNQAEPAVSTFTEEEKKNWKYVRETPSRKDYMRLGKAVGIMLTDKNYKWVKYFDVIHEGMDMLFPKLSTEDFWKYNEDIKWALARAKDTQNEFKGYTETF